MEKLTICRICLVGNVRMHVVSDIPRQEIYEKLTIIPFVTEDSRPMLACFFCYARLEQCYKFWQKCVEAEAVFTQILNDEYEHKPILAELGSFGGFIKSTIEHFDIEDLSQQEDEREDTRDIKEELTGGNEAIEHIELKVEYHSDGVPVAKQPKLDMREENFEDLTPTKNEKNEQANSKVIDRTKSNKFKSVTKIIKPIKSYPNTNLVIQKNIMNRNSENAAICTNLSNNINNNDLKIHHGDINCDAIKVYNGLNRNNLSEEKPYKYNICQSSFNQKQNSKRHVHTSKKPYKCDICQTSFIQKNDLNEHNHTHTAEIPYKCDISQSSFTDQRYLKRHNNHIHTGGKTHIGKKQYKCDTCQKSFNRKDNLRTHIRVHTGERPHKCDICQKSFIQKNDLKKHNIRIHTGEKPYKCHICPKGYIQKNDLITHIRAHTGERPYKCDICPKGYIQKNDLITHIRAHTGEKPYKCDICQSTFTDPRYLKKHITRRHTVKKTHTGEKPHKCDTCHRSFLRKCNLLTHIRTHTDEKPYKCDGSE